MAEGGSLRFGQPDERTKTVLKFRELVRGRLTEEEVTELLKQHDWNLGRATELFLKSDPNDLREMLHRDDEDEIEQIQKDEIIQDLLKKQNPRAETRLFACQECDRVWWRVVPARKTVSQCMQCRTRYEAIPRSQEWGWAVFVCECTREFSGYGQMNVTQSECYRNKGGCGRMAFPARIIPSTRHHRRPLSRAQHSCNAPDCPIYHHSGSRHNPYRRYPNHGGRQKYGYHPYTVTSRMMYRRDPVCIHPISRQNKRKVVVPSEVHRSTGSTVDTFLSQGNLYTFHPRLDTISEEGYSEDEEGR